MQHDGFTTLEITSMYSFALRRSVVALALIVAASPVARAQMSTRTMSFAMNAINQIAVAGAPAVRIMTVEAARAPKSATIATANGADKESRRNPFLSRRFRLSRRVAESVDRHAVESSADIGGS